MQTFLRGDPFKGPVQKLEQLDVLVEKVPIENPPAIHAPSPAASDDTGVDGSIHWITLVCIILAACIGFLVGRWSSKRSTNYAALPLGNVTAEQLPTANSCVELSEVT